MIDPALATRSDSNARSSGPREACWCVDADTRDHVIARRNVLAGLWTGRRLGLAGDPLTHYAASLHAADFAMPGDADVVETILRDLEAAGVPATAADVRRVLDACHRQALLETLCTD